jgi:uncharacterized protein YrrD
MQFTNGTEVFTFDGEKVGKINRVVLNPSTQEISHVVIQKGMIFPEDKVVPVEMIDSTREDKVKLDIEKDRFDELPPFEESHYILMDEELEANREVMKTTATPPVYYWYPPYSIGYPALAYGPYPGTIIETERNIPKHSIALEEGANVVSAEGKKIGDIERVISDSQTNQATHFLISKGFLFKEKKLVPANWVRIAEENEVQLLVGTKVLERLPEFEE